MKNRTANLNTARGAGGFTLLEVMIAVVIFCTASFAIMGLVSQSIAIAQRLERPMVDAGLVASELSLTNRLVEGRESGDLRDLLGEDYKGYNWTYNVEEEQTNKLFKVDITVNRNDADRSVVSQMSVLFYRPDSPAGSMDKGLGFHP
jgi:type II secretion system protein I